METNVPGHEGRYGRTSDIVVLDEDHTAQLQHDSDSTKYPGSIFVANAIGGIGVVIKGFNPEPYWLEVRRRLVGSNNFKTAKRPR